jgi:hypothetical protein
MATGDPRVVREDARYWLLGSYSGLTKARDVLAEAQRIITSMSALARFELGCPAPLLAGNIEHVNQHGKKTYVLLAEPGSISIRGMFISMSVTRQDGTVQTENAADRAAAWLRLADNPEGASLA